MSIFPGERRQPPVIPAPTLAPRVQCIGEMLTKRALMILALAATAAACGAAEDEIDDIDESINCLNACQAYDDCVAPDGFDVTVCQMDCEEMALMSDIFEEQTETCDACIAEGFCEGESFLCESECAGIVP